MIFKYITILLNAITYHIVAADNHQAYIAVHENDYDPFEIIKDNNSTETQSIMQLGEKTWSMAALTNSDVLKVQKNLKANDILAKDDDTFLPDYDMAYTADDSKIDNNNFLNDAPRCNAEVNNVDFVVIDTALYTQINEFKGVQIKIIASYLFPFIPCNTHGTKVAALIAGDKTGIITKGDRTINGFTVFDCFGQGKISASIAAVRGAIEFAEQQKMLGRKVVINYSGVSGANAAFDAAAKAAINAGVAFVAAAGNSAENAMEYSPARTKDILTVGSTQAPGNITARFSNYGEIVDVFMPGKDITVTSVYSDGTEKSSGTSFTAPILTARVGMEYQNNPDSRVKEIFDKISQETISVESPQGKMRIVPKDYACPNTNPVITITTTKQDLNKFNLWLPMNNNSCTKFNAKLLNNKGWAMIGLKNDYSDSFAYKIVIDKKLGKQFANVIEDKYGSKNNIFNSQRLLKSKQDITLQIKNTNNSILVQYYNKQNQLTKLVENTDTDNSKFIAFSAAGGGKIQYQVNKISC